MKRPTTWIALLALVLSFTGGAVAANYVISSPKQIKPRVITGKHIKKGSLGPELLKGSSTTVRKVEGTIPGGGQDKVKAPCASGEKATGGGYGDTSSVVVLSSRPDPESGTPSAWVVEAYDAAVPPGDRQLPVYVVCTK